jgi:hypothetical protein
MGCEAKMTFSIKLAHAKMENWTPQNIGAYVHTQIIVQPQGFIFES